MCSDLQIPDANGPDPGADQLQDFGSQSFHHPPDLAIASFSNCDLEERVAPGIADALYLGGPSRSIRQHHAVPQLAELLVAKQ